MKAKTSLMLICLIVFWFWVGSYNTKINFESCMIDITESWREAHSKMPKWIEEDCREKSFYLMFFGPIAYPFILVERHFVRETFGK